MTKMATMVVSLVRKASYVLTAALTTKKQTTKDPVVPGLPLPDSIHLMVSIFSL